MQPHGVPFCCLCCPSRDFPLDRATLGIATIPKQSQRNTIKRSVSVDKLQMEYRIGTRPCVVILLVSHAFHV